MTFWRRTRGLVKIQKSERIRIEQIAKQHHVPPPVTVLPDLEPLEELGQAISRGFPTSSTAKTVRALYTEKQLVAIAEESDNHYVLLAVSHLLGL